MNVSSDQQNNSENRWKSTLFRLLQWTWGLPQTLSGALIYLWYRHKNCPHERFHGACVTIWPHKSSLSLGMFLFLTDAPFHYYKVQKKHFTEIQFARRMAVHEYGHSIQSLIFGPLYLLTVGLPSILWANLPWLRRWRERNQRSYFSVYPENHANKLGEKVLGEPSIGSPLS